MAETPTDEDAGRFVGLFRHGDAYRPLHECPHCYALVIGRRLADHVKGCRPPSVDPLENS